MSEEEKLMRRAVGIYERGHYFPGDAPASREEIINEIYKGLREVHLGNVEPIVWDDDLP